MNLKSCFLGGSFVPALVLLSACPGIEVIDGEVESQIPEPVQRAFDESCAIGGCHDSSTKQGGLSLASGDSDALLVTDSRSGEPYVVIGDRKTSYLASVLQGDTPFVMPPGGTQNEPAKSNVETILDWIEGKFEDGSDNDED